MNFRLGQLKGDINRVVVACRMDYSSDSFFELRDVPAIDDLESR